jgi:outer membrane protein assembly factor BamB
MHLPNKWLTIPVWLVVGIVQFNLLLGGTSASWAESSGWRNDGSGTFPETQPPATWSKESNVVWKVKMPGHSISSPIVAAGKVFTLAHPSTLLCLNEDDGEILWQSEHDYRSVLGEKLGKKVLANLVKAEEVRKAREALQREYEEARKEEADPEVVKPKFEPRIQALEKQYEELTAYPPIPDGTPGNTASTPVSDGKTVWAVFGTGVVSAHDVSGSRLWARFVANPRDRHSASPLLVGDLLIVDLKGLMALRASTGETVWEAKTHSRAGTVMAAEVGGMQLLVTPGGEVVNATDGVVLAKDLFGLNYTSPLVHEDVIYAIESGSSKAIRLFVQDGQLRHQLLWEKEAARDDRLGSPVWHEGVLYTVTGKGIIDVYDAETGESVYKQRLALRDGRLDPSLALAGGNLYVSTNRGTTMLVQPGRKFKSLGQNELEEEFSSSPTFDGKRVYIRTGENLYCLGE